MARAMGKRAREHAAVPHGDEDELEFQEVASTGLQDGPSSAEELFRWPVDLLRTVTQDDGNKSRLFSMICNGIINDTDYSGLDSHREVCHQLELAMATELGWIWTGPHGPETRLRFLRSCDWAPGPQKVLHAIATKVDGSATCVFPDMESRLPSAAVAYLDSLQPETLKKENFTPAKSEDAAKRYSEMASWLLENRSWLFTADSKSECLVHQGSGCSSRLQRPPALPRALRCNWAGTTCVGWSPRGNKFCHADSSERCHAVWLAERLQKAETDCEDLFIQENVPRSSSRAQNLNDGTLVVIMS